MTTTTAFTASERADLAAFDATIDAEPDVVRGHKRLDPQIVRAVGVRIRTYRHRRELSGQALATAIGAGRGTVLNIERGTGLSLTMLYDLADALGCAPGDLLPTRDEIAGVSDA